MEGEWKKRGMGEEEGEYRHKSLSVTHQANRRLISSTASNTHTHFTTNSLGSLVKHYVPWLIGRDHAAHFAVRRHDGADGEVISSVLPHTGHPDLIARRISEYDLASDPVHCHGRGTDVVWEPAQDFRLHPVYRHSANIT